MILQPIIDLASICAKKGIKEAILSPGSRCAPISLAFIRHPDIHCRTISDERSAAFMALGMAQQLEKPVALVCTSGSAALNYAPAIAEAYFQEIPLLVITADRPAEWIDQWDGQTIRQENIYGKHIKGSFNFPDDFSHKDRVWHAHRITNEAVNLAYTIPKGPVHINIPIREPFYPLAEENFNFKGKMPLFEELKGEISHSEETHVLLKTHLSNYKKILIVPGQQRPNPEIRFLLEKLSAEKKAVVLCDVLCNLHSDSTISFHELILQASSDKDPLAPDLIISFGKSIISKSLKLFLRSCQAVHWHVRTAGYVPDTYQHLDKVILASPLYFLKVLDKQLDIVDLSFLQSWTDAELKVEKALPELMQSAGFGEFKGLYTCLSYIPYPSKIHLANSMPVRYANFMGMGKQKWEILCNRGTSGIDGSNSSAVGCTFTTKEPVTLVTGDMAFFYDRNAFWHQYNLPNLRIILLNNHAGGIFRLIEGPSQLPELEEYFETRQTLEAASLSQEFGFEYYRVTNMEDLHQSLENFYHKSIKPKILEIKSKSNENEAILKKIKSGLKEKLS